MNRPRRNPQSTLLIARFLVLIFVKRRFGRSAAASISKPDLAGFFYMEGMPRLVDSVDFRRILSMLSVSPHWGLWGWGRASDGLRCCRHPVFFVPAVFGCGDAVSAWSMILTIIQDSQDLGYDAPTVCGIPQRVRFIKNLILSSLENLVNPAHVWRAVSCIAVRLRG